MTLPGPRVPGPLREDAEDGALDGSVRSTEIVGAERRDGGAIHALEYHGQAVHPLH